VDPAARPSASGAAQSAAAGRARANPPLDRAAVVRDPAFAQNARQAAVRDTRANQYYWHTYNGHRYAHYLDSRGADWYGIYAGRSFYWTRYHANRWWWHDPAYSTWVFYDSGYWWWPQPGGGNYVYHDGAYYPYDSSKVTAPEPEKAEPPSGEPPSKEAPAAELASPDGTRVVRIVGPQMEAQLLDRAHDGKTTLRKTIDDGVTDASWSGSGGSQRLKLTFADGRSAVYDHNGGELEQGE
jgi:hypothetical protein